MSNDSPGPQYVNIEQFNLPETALEVALGLPKKWIRKIKKGLPQSPALGVRGCEKNVELKTKINLWKKKSNIN